MNLFEECEVAVWMVENTDPAHFNSGVFPESIYAFSFEHLSTHDNLQLFSKRRKNTFLTTRTPSIKKIGNVWMRAKNRHQNFCVRPELLWFEKSYSAKLARDTRAMCIYIYIRKMQICSFRSKIACYVQYVEKCWRMCEKSTRELPCFEKSYSTQVSMQKNQQLHYFFTEFVTRTSVIWKIINLIYWTCPKHTLLFKS